MQQEKSIVEIHLGNGSTSLTIGTHVGQFIVFSESLPTAGCPHTTCDVELLAYNVFPDAVDGFDVTLVTCESCYICHTCIHVSCTDSVTHSFILFQDRFVALAILIQTVIVASCIVESVRCHPPCCITFSTLIEEKLGHIQILLVACSDVEFRQAHLCNLMTWHHAGLSRFVAHLSTYTIGILDGNVEEILLACSIIMCHCCLAEVTEIVELMTQIFHAFPTFGTSPFMRVLGVLGT